MMKSILLVLALSNLCLAQAQNARPSDRDSLSLRHMRKLDAGPQVGLGLGVGKGSMLFVMAGWQLNEEYAIEARLDARSVIPNSDLAWGDSGGWSILVRRQFPRFFSYVFAGPSLEHSIFSSEVLNYGLVTRKYHHYYWNFGIGVGIHWFSLEFETMVPLQRTMYTPPPSGLTGAEVPSGRPINPFVYYVIIKPHLDLFLFH